MLKYKLKFLTFILFIVATTYFTCATISAVAAASWASGKVVDSKTGEPIPGLPVLTANCVGIGCSTFTDKDGKFSIILSGAQNGADQVFVPQTSWYTGSSAANVKNGDSLTLMVSLLQPADVTFPEVTLKQSPIGVAYLTGFVTDPANGQPLSDASIAVVNSPNHTTTDKNGYFKMQISPGPNRITVSISDPKVEKIFLLKFFQINIPDNFIAQVFLGPHPAQSIIDAVMTVKPVTSTPSHFVKDPINEGQRTLLSGNVNTAVIPTLNDVGAVPPDTQLGGSIFFHLNPNTSITSEQYLEEMNDPTSPRFRKTITSAQYIASYEISQHDFDTIANWLKSHHLEILHTNQDRGGLSFQGKVSDISEAFAVSIHYYTQPNDNEKYYSITTEPSLPTAIAPAVMGIKLDNFGRFLTRPIVSGGPGSAPVKHPPLPNIESASVKKTLFQKIADFFRNLFQ